MRNSRSGNTFSGPYFPVFGLTMESTPYLSVFSSNAGKYGPEKTLYLDTFHAVVFSLLEFRISLRI